MTSIFILLFSLPFLFCYVPLKKSYFMKSLQEEQFLKIQGLTTAIGANEDEEGSGEENLSSVDANLTTSSTSTETGKCWDQSSNCGTLKTLCDSAVYKQVMIRSCAKTCNVCEHFLRLPFASRCRDSFISCPSWAKRGFCHSSYYTLGERQSICRKSCGDC